MRLQRKHQKYYGNPYCDWYKRVFVAISSGKHDRLGINVKIRFTLSVGGKNLVESVLR